MGIACFSRAGIIQALYGDLPVTPENKDILDEILRHERRPDVERLLEGEELSDDGDDEIELALLMGPPDFGDFLMEMEHGRRSGTGV